MIIPAYSLTATERVIPKLALDFTTASLDPRVSVARSLNTATRTNSNGYIETINANLPRFDFSPTSVGTCRGLLIEETRTNIFLQSENFTVSPWVAIDCPVTANQTTAPSGVSTANRLLPNTANSQHYVYQLVSLVSGQTYTISIYAKPDGYKRFLLRESSFSGKSVAFDVSTGAVVATNGATAPPPVAVGNGWYRCEMTFSAISSANTVLAIVVLPDTGTSWANASFAANGTSAIFAWGAQCDSITGGNANFATSYIPTTTTSQTRNADVVTMTGSNFSDWWTSTIGAATARAQQISVSAISPWVQFDDTTANNIIALRGNTTNPELYIKATTDQAQIDAGTIAANTNYGLSGAWNTDNCAAALNGAAAVTDLSATIPTVTQARLGSDGTNYLNGWLQSLRYWPQRLTNAEVQAFSKL
jgi:hypothetical protein